MSSSPHQPVLLSEVLSYLSPKRGDAYLDLTAGYGGHAEAVIEQTQAPMLATLVDRDQEAITYLNKNSKAQGLTIIHKDYFAASQELISQGKQFDIILADLGVSSLQLDKGGRGFSLRQDGPLDMRMDQAQALTAEKIVNTYSKQELIGIFRTLGEESKAAKIAAQIVKNRPIQSTIELSNLVAKTKWRRTKVHPATNIFQALRIAVNQELELLEKALPLWLELLKPNGRLAVISFHSLEDRMVKQKFEEEGGNRYDSSIKILTKSPITATKSEIVLNPRARSAKLRAVVKIKI